MPVITLPDGDERRFEGAVDGRRVAESIGAGLAKAALAVEVDGQLRDLVDPIEADAAVRVITPKDAEGLEIIRHSCAHLLGQAVKQLRPQAQMVIGPVIEDGFYYDIRTEPAFTPEDMAAIEARMRELLSPGYEVIKTMTPREEARRLFAERGEEYKVRLIDEMDESVAEMGLYRHQEYLDMCRGPHVPHTRFLKVFALTRLSGAYWRGDAANEMLQRVYGTAWAEPGQLKDWRRRLEEAEKRDHRRIGAKHDLFHFEEDSPGMVFWHPRGWTLYRLLEERVREHMVRAGYTEVHTPQMLPRSLWERTGHWDKFGRMIFATESEKREYAIKPMNCPAHVRIFNQRLRSHHELPLRMAEFGVVHRNEPSGTLHGLLRARRFTQDDGHVFCREDQVGDEVRLLFDQITALYAELGFDKVSLALSTRPDDRVGDDEQWDRAEAALEAALRERGCEYQLQEGEGAFYGPKIEFTLEDSIGRRWQCGTIQLDFSMPGRLGAEYVDSASARVTPVMIHRAMLGSLERFIGIMIEHHAGELPLWLAPVQLVVANITDRQAEYAETLRARLAAGGWRAEADLRNEKIGHKIRDHALAGVPLLAVVGDREMEAGTAALRRRDGADLGAMNFEELDKYLRDGVK